MIPRQKSLHRVAKQIRPITWGLVLTIWATASAWAGITLEMRSYRFSSEGYVFYTPLTVNGTPPAAPQGFYVITSPQSPANGAWRLLEFNGTDFNTISGAETVANDFNDFMNRITNGLWTITVTNASSTNIYKFAVAAGTVNSNHLPLVNVTAPTYNATVGSQPVFTWSGPSSWLGSVDVHDFWIDPDDNWQYQVGASLSAPQSSWPCPVELPSGQNYFSVTYRTNSTLFFTATTPTNVIGGAPLAGWAINSDLEGSANVFFNVADNSPATPPVARYNFEDPGWPGRDTSGNNNHNNCSSSSGDPTPDTADTDAAVGTYARKFFGDTGYCFTDGGSAFPNLSNALSGSFTVTAWVKTTAAIGFDEGDAGWGNPIFYADNNGANHTIPLAITGSKAAFSIYDEYNDPTTIHSTTSVNNGAYHFLAVTRDQTSGQMRLYVNGQLEATATATTAPLEPAMYVGLASGNWFYEGLLDDVRLYATNLSAAEIATLAGNTPGLPLGEALDNFNLPWTTGGNADWFGQTSITHDGVDAARSGAIGNDSDSWIQTTVTGPGTLAFWWRVSSDDWDSYDWLELTVNNSYWDEIAGDSGWIYQQIHLGSGSHTIRWTYYKDWADAANLDAAFLDEVSFTPDSPPTITFQPLDQTNYPGYIVSLVADAVATPEANWQWHKIGAGAIPGAIQRFLQLTNSGTAGVAGSYYAVAANSAGGINTRTAIVTFVNAPAPPDWSKAFQTQLTGNFDEPRTNYGIAMLVDNNGDVYSANSFSGLNYFTTNTFSSGPGRFASGLFKHTATGTALWGRAITNNGTGNSYPQCLAPAPGNGVYMSGVFHGTNQIGTNLLQSAPNNSWLYLARFDAAGNVLWVRTFGGTNGQFQSYHQLVADEAGNVTISALGNNFVNFGTTNVTLQGQKGILVQYDANGTLRWISQPSGWAQYLTYQANRIYAVLGGSETNYIGGLTNLSDRRFVLAALNATNGHALWLQPFGASLVTGNPDGVSDDTPAVAVSGADLFLTGTAWGGSATFGAQTVTWPVNKGQYLARYHTNGTAQLATSFGGTNTWPWAAVADASGNVYVSGDFDGYATFGDKLIGGPRLGGIDSAFRGQMFVAKFNRDGQSLWVKQAQSEVPTSFVNTRDIALASDGVWTCGFVNYYANFGTNLANRVYGPVTVLGMPFGTIHYWVGGFLAKVGESGVGSPLAVTLLNPQTSGANFQFQFQSQAGFTHAVQYRTNLVTGQNWQTYSNVSGDGGLKTIGVPQSLFSPAPQGFIRISTQ